MLRFLRIRRLAVIDAVEVEFGPGFNVLTGETGAGKSMLVEAVGLLLGGRASADLVRTGEETAAVEALFDCDGEELLVRREVTAQGRSRAFINDALVTAGALKDLAARLLELHGQHEHQTLLDPATHLEVLDAFGRLEALQVPVSEAFELLRSIDDELKRVRQAVADRDKQLDFLTFQLGEIERAAPRPGEDEELAATRRVLASAERVARLCAEGYAELYESDGAALNALGAVWKRVSELAELDPAFRPFVEARTGIKSQLEDLAQYLRRYGEGVDASPARLQQVEERLALLERLKRKYGPTLADVLTRRATLEGELKALEQGDQRAGELERARQAARETYVVTARALSDARQKAAGEFARSLERLLSGLAMERTRFDVRFAGASEAAWSARGLDEVEFFLSPNVGEEVRPLARIVSGGELSRIMLAIKTLVAGGGAGLGDGSGRTPSGSAPGLIFDEIDAGIGGRVADIVGRRLRALGSRSQVLCITHLPQIAAYGDTHYGIRKEVSGGRTRTVVTRLGDGERIEEVARMLGGEVVSDGLRASAREMLLRRGLTDGEGAQAKGEAKPKGESERAKAKGPKARN